MKINSFNRPDTNPYSKQINHVEKQTRTERMDADQIQISKEAKELQQSSRFDAERKARVEQLKNQIEQGNYKVDPKKVAYSMAKYYFNQ
ncbi:flagellar biosynthesis anti-sigma factor FlgM [Siminovitchia fortis]|uniref:Negative regulator of flagellin synthesis n=1 Tax=Siminovitchia fortis TaxID=254758 RepID=A0A443IZP9_9BACI|nr:flagellar biosynthesis anti-sigma factor FlgM [Siminovitchia fortis]RWR13590.1 flagellar biosynthesis anti-sigma factor FlgM [Siminovitchia fortis]WHY81953.1 flagellar biosynthesis anti-sigma factor FlgM [Siminovitchia fortis]